MPRLLVSLAVAASALGACGGSSAQPEGAATTAAGPSQQVLRAPQVLTAAHHGRTFRLEVGRDVELQLAPGSTVRARGGAVRLVPIDFVADPGYAAWSVSAVARGTAVLRGRSAGTPFRVTLVVA